MGPKKTAAKSKAASSGEGGSRTASPSSSPRSVVGTYELTGLHTTWDNNPTIRERARSNQNLMLAVNPATGETGCWHVDGTKDTVVLNECVLLPLAELMGKHELKLPSIDNLIESVNQFFKVTKMARNLEHCYQEAWAIRRCLGKLKSFAYKEHPPQDLLF